MTLCVKELSNLHDDIRCKVLYLDDDDVVGQTEDATPSAVLLAKNQGNQHF